MMTPFISYKGRVDRLKTELSKKYGSGIKFEEERTPNISGKFEVFVNEALIHSKIDGNGFVDSDEKMAKITSAIDKASS
uniref:Selenoprotein W n=1 Tax=Amphimedon queenslandica TaxID=400682 RepID=A0A1X7V4P5_AMPQE